MKMIFNQALKTTNLLSINPTPRNTKNIRFIGFASYFRKFIPRFSIIAKPLYELIKKDVMFKFGVEENKAFKALKARLSNHLILVIYCPATKTELHCDANANGFGAILYYLQQQESSSDQYRISATDRHRRNLNTPTSSWNV